MAPLSPSEHGPALRGWLERGDQAEMGYMGRRLEARTGERVAAFYELTVRRLQSRGPTLAQVARALEEHYRVRRVLGDKLSRARALWAGSRG